jgi:VWFA-related protein
MRNRESICSFFAAPVLAGLVFSLAGVSGQLAIAQTAQPSPSETQSTASSAPVLRVQTREVVLPVTVRDKKGALVTTLKASDLTLTDDGRPQTIKILTRDRALPFRLGLLFDTSRGMSGVLENERKSAGKFLDRMLSEEGKSEANGQQNQAFLIHFDSEVELLEDFTGSSEKLRRELDTMGTTRSQSNVNNGPESVDDDRSERGNRGVPRGNRGGATLYDAIYLASDELMKSQEGHKALLVVSNGVDSGSKESLNDAVDAADRAGLSVYTIYFKGEQQRDKFNVPDRSNGQRGGMGGGWPGGGGGNNPGGDRRDSGSEKSSIDGKNILEKIATRTGGRAFEAKKKDSLEDIFNQIAEELRGQYLLSYSPDQDQKDEEDDYHKLAVKANRDGLVITAREGYYVPGKK